mmetsp:Transcript_13480/g.43044  ORF Transcript_13480/g.43044 Transcript_13480/m.43044 type:complete len:287 (-) Transcript_13480:302-1162(-)
MPREQQVVVHERIRVVLPHLSRHEHVQLAQHEEQQLKLVQVAVQMHEEVATQEGSAGSRVRKRGRHVEDGPEARAQVAEHLLPRVDAKLLGILQDELQAVGDEGVLVVAAEDLGVDLAIRGVLERLEHEHHRHEELLLAHREAHHGVAVVQVVQVHGDGALVRLDAADGAGAVAEGGATLGECRPRHRHHVVAARHLQHADATLDAIAHEISPQLGCVLVAPHQLPRSGRRVVAPVGAHHDGHVAQLLLKRVHRTIADPAPDGGQQRARVRDAPLPALGWKQTAAG